MHHIYTTEGIILKREAQDSSAYYYLLTRDLGLVRARAQGVRKAESRLKGALQEFSLTTVAFVHAKNGWKITTAIPEKNFFNETHDLETRKIMARISDCLIRLIAGEEKNTQIFEVVAKGFSTLAHEGGNQSVIESILLTRILHSLGYIPSDENTSKLLADFSDFGAEATAFAVAHKSQIIQAVNKGFQESQL